jgi:hypothetical protein
MQACRLPAALPKFRHLKNRAEVSPALAATPLQLAAKPLLPNLHALVMARADEREKEERKGPQLPQSDPPVQFSVSDSVLLGKTPHPFATEVACKLVHNHVRIIDGDHLGAPHQFNRKNPLTAYQKAPLFVRLHLRVDRRPPPRQILEVSQCLAHFG